MGQRGPDGNERNRRPAVTPAKVGRNDACPCGSGRKFKHCCQAKEARAGFAAGTALGSQPPAALRERLQPLFLEAKRHFDARRWAEAIPLFREIVRLDPNSPQAHHDLGMVWLFSGRPAEAAASLERAVELSPASTARSAILPPPFSSSGANVKPCSPTAGWAEAPMTRPHAGSIWPWR